MAVKNEKSPDQARDIGSSRRRAGLNVVLSIVVAAALLIVLNVIGAFHGVRRDIESAGRYGLSDSSKRVLERITQPVRVTCIYTSTKADRKPEQYLPRLKDLLEEMHQANDLVKVAAVSSDRDKAEVLGRLRQKLEETAGKHRKAVAEFQALAAKQGQAYEAMMNEWRAYPANGWLAQFGVAKQIESALQAGKDEVSKLDLKFRQDLEAATLPNYPDMVKQEQEAMERVRDLLEGIRKILRDMAELPDKAQKARDPLAKAAAAVVDELGRAQGVLSGKSATTPATAATKPADPSLTLDRFCAAMRAAADAAEVAARELDTFGRDSVVRAARAWRLEEGAIPNRYRQIANAASQLADQSQAVRQAAKTEVQAEFVGDLREAMPDLARVAGQAQAGVLKLVAELSQPADEATARIFEQVKKPEFLQAPVEAVKALLQDIGQLPELADQGELIDQINQDNIVLVEAGGKYGVVPFDEVWPLAERRQDMMPTDEDEQEQRRVFNGDMALASKVLSMTSEPFAEVVLTSFERVPPRQMWNQMPPQMGPIPTMALTTLRQRLEKANLKVTEWKLAEQDAPPEPAGKNRPRVLLVVPPPEPMPQMGEGPMGGQFGPEHVERLRKVIAGGTPAIFLAGYFRPQGMGFMAVPPAFGWGEYLKNDWGLDVRTSLKIVMGQSEGVQAGAYELPVLRWTFLPLANFTNHPIGRPLQARRLYWYEACPVLWSPSENKAEVENVLVVPPNSGGKFVYWATASAEKLQQRMYMGTSTSVSPDQKAGDLLPETEEYTVGGKKMTRDKLSVAVKARQGQNAVVVLGVGMSYIDPFLNTRVPQLKGGETLSSEPPPSGDVDLVVNATYDLAGKGEFIGAGPVQVQPIALIAPNTMRMIRLGFGVFWPLAVLLAGMVVLWWRR